ncbi:gliding motility protein GldM [Pedobacter sp. SYSU D00535]|uniref:type IX secretion system motor protein PorM/GldM n=1 Tax=Pedobacter sp. SYSU D00535 TaxID=2810308 RepID=UPI001A96E9E0|nr:gliding motility protein GldM [Pedobacter sp. SYSU D00535]
MAGGKESARQKMINIMYLVLLAMLALNVSETILNAFKNINDSLETSRKNVDASVSQLVAAFESTKLKEEPQRAQPIYEKAKQAQKIAGDLNTYIETLKQKFVTAGQGIDPASGDLVERGNVDIAPGIMINQKEGAKLKQQINDTREKLLALLDAKDRASVTFSLEAKDPEKLVNGVRKSWEENNFGEGTPLTAAMTILTKIQSDVKNAESDVIKKLFGKMDQAVVNLDKFAAVAVAPTSYLIQGQPYTAEVFLTAYDSKANPSITVNGSPLSVKDGRGMYSVNTGREGVFSWKGRILVKQTDGSVKEYFTPEQKYQVARPSATISPTKMNVFYIGVPNPVSISAPGIPKESLRVSMSGGSISGTNGEYTVRVTSPGTAKVTVSADVGGKVQAIGTTDFRVKRIPDPIAKFAGKTGGSMPSVAIKAQSSLFAVLEGFEFDAKFNVTRFTMIVQKPRQDPVVIQGSGNDLNAAMRSALAGIGPGSRVIFDNIIAVGPDGSSRQLNSIPLTAN